MENNSEKFPINIEGKYDQFIGIYENAVPKDLCLDMISYFHDLEKYNLVYSRKQTEKIQKLKKHDTAFDFNDPMTNKIRGISNRLIQTTDVGMMIIKDYLYNCLVHYIDEYDVLKETVLGTSHNKIQKTEIGGGYHIWHHEHGPGYMNRVLVYTIYLNDVFEGGETELLYQHKRIPARMGTVCIFPANFTHTHRGNPPISNEKYILTGWVEQIDHLEHPFHNH